MARVPRQRTFTKATHAESALKGESAGVAKRSHPLERLKAEGTRHLAPESPEFHRPKEVTYTEQRCVTRRSLDAACDVFLMRRGLKGHPIHLSARRTTP
jgi:hypothetical protein